MMVSDDQRVENKQQKSTQGKTAVLLREDDMFPCIHYLYGISLDMTSLLGLPSS